MGPGIIIGGVLLAAILVLAILMAKRKKKKPVHSADVYRNLLGVNGGAAAGARSPEAEALRQNLRVKLLHQEDKIDAAIAFERERNPAASEEQLMKAAIERWERDNR